MKNILKNYLQPNWPAPQGVHAYTTARSGGQSKEPYATFNLADHVGDNLQDVLANRARLKQELHLPAEPVWLEQTHSAKVVRLDSGLLKQIQTSQIKPNADASYTLELNVVCTVLTADCLPILLCDRGKNFVAAIHAGWKGLLAGVIENTLETIARDIGADTIGKNALVWLGPAICRDAFQIDDELRAKFIAVDSAADKAFVKAAAGKWLCNIYTLACQRLHRFGIETIYGGDLCTARAPDKFFSYRHDGAVTGRMASLIWMDDR